MKYGRKSEIGIKQSDEESSDGKKYLKKFDMRKSRERLSTAESTRARLSTAASEIN